ncbi:MAG: hypothetical protein K6T17_03360 [Fimbriimonadales bacterium]|nr:hypothetical protein [Fimbriimonadales bacterium]
MRWKLIHIQCLSPYLTPWRAPTLWGRLAWIIAEGAIPDWDISTFISFYKENQPPLILSDGLPKDAIPTPLHWQSAWAQSNSKPPKTLPWDTLNALRQNPSQPPREAEGEHERGEREIALWRTAIDRATGKASEGALRADHGWIAPQGILIFALVHNVFTDETLQKLFLNLSAEGWGNMRSSGNGAFKVQSIQDFNPDINDPDGFMLLAHCHPTKDMPAEGLWKLNSVPVLPHHPDTGRPVGPLPPPQRATMLAPGASFKEKQPKPFYGTLLPLGRIHPDYLHYGIAPALPIKLQNRSTSSA